MTEQHPTSGAASDGFTIVEVVVAVTIIAIAFASAVLLFDNGIVASGNIRNRVVAAQLAAQAMENIRGTAADPTKFTTISAGQTVFTQTVNGITYTITQDAQFVAQGSTQSSCDSPGNNSGMILAVNEKVTWKGMAGTQPVQSSTDLAPPVGAYSQSSGSIAVKVFNASSQVAPNINIKIAGPVTQTQATTAEGCAFFPFLTPGTYAVSVIQGTGVGDQEVVTPTQNASVSVGQTVSIQFNYDSGATISVTGWSTTPAATPAATGIPVSVANTGLQPYGQYSYATGLTSLTPLFPYSSGYTVFAGNCTDNNPLGKDTNRNPLYTAASFPGGPPAALGVSPGQTSSTAVPLYTLSLHVQHANATPAPTTNVTAAETTTFGAPYTAVCTSGTGSGSTPTIGLVQTDANGNSVTAVPLVTGRSPRWARPSH